MKKKFENEVKRRKHNLDCMMKGEYPQEMVDMGMPRKLSPPLRASTAMRHLKGIQDYEKVVEIVQIAFLDPLEECRDNNQPLTDFMIETVEKF
jgi:hypothetical protein